MSIYNINLSILVDLPSPITYAKIQPQGILGLEKKTFKGFYHIWAWRPPWSINCDHFSILSFPQPKEAPYEIWAKLAQRLQRRSRLKFWIFFPYKCIRKQNWPNGKKVKCQSTTIILATFGALQFPMIFSHKASSVLENKIFFKVFPIQMHREANLTLP